MQEEDIINQVNKLIKYSEHKPRCRYNQNKYLLSGSYDCDCGYSEVLHAIRVLLIPSNRDNT